MLSIKQNWLKITCIKQKCLAFTKLCKIGSKIAYHQAKFAKLAEKLQSTEQMACLGKAIFEPIMHGTKQSLAWHFAKMLLLSKSLSKPLLSTKKKFLSKYFLQILSHLLRAKKTHNAKQVSRVCWALNNRVKHKPES